jgi:hypothetical protein
MSIPTEKRADTNKQWIELAFDKHVGGTCSLYCALIVGDEGTCSNDSLVGLSVASILVEGSDRVAFDTIFKGVPKILPSPT